MHLEGSGLVRFHTARAGLPRACGRAGRSSPYATLRHDTHRNNFPLPRAAGNLLRSCDGLPAPTRYHWYGSTKKETGSCVFECSYGVNLYTSYDLLTWKFVGLVFNHTQIKLPLFPAAVKPYRIERPKVIYNAATAKFVLVFHCEDAPYNIGARGVASSASPTGPFAWVGADHANGQYSMDMTEYVDPNDPTSQAYHIRTSRVAHGATQWTVGSKLSRDYLTVSGSAPCFNTSTSTEGQAMLYHGGAYYLFGSHLSGLAPNPARLLRCKAAVLADCCTEPGAPTKVSGRVCGRTAHDKDLPQLPKPGRS